MTSASLLPGVGPRSCCPFCWRHLEGSSVQNDGSSQTTWMFNIVQILFQLGPMDSTAEVDASRLTGIQHSLSGVLRACSILERRIHGASPCSQTMDVDHGWHSDCKKSWPRSSRSQTVIPYSSLTYGQLCTEGTVRAQLPGSRLSNEDHCQILELKHGRCLMGLQYQLSWMACKQPRRLDSQADFKPLCWIGSPVHVYISTWPNGLVYHSHILPPITSAKVCAKTFRPCHTCSLLPISLFLSK